MPAVSTGQQFSLSVAWRATRGNGCRRLAAYLLTTLPALGLSFLIQFSVVTSDFGIYYDPYASLYRAIESLATAPIRLIAVALFVTVAIGAFRSLGRQGKPPSGLVERFD